MASVNKVILIGNVGRQPTSNVMPGGELAANISIATTDKYKDRTSGEAREVTEWHRVAFYGRLAEIVRDLVKKGSQVYIEGRIKTRKYTDKDGVEKFSTDIVAHELQLLGPKSPGQSRQDQPGSPAPAGNPESAWDDTDDMPA